MTVCFHCNTPLVLPTDLISYQVWGVALRSGIQGGLFARLCKQARNGCAVDYPTQKQFAQAILAFFRETIPKEWKNFRDKVSDNFRVINHENFRILA